MTMHLLPAFVTTTKVDRKTKKSTKLKRSKFEHAQFIAKMTGGKKADKSYLATKWRSEYAEDIAVDRSGYVSAGIEGNCPKVPEKVYTGGNLVGIATMHKSNMVPVFADNKEAAADIARMRR